MGDWGRETHLMLGIGNALLIKIQPKSNYCSSEKFMNDYVGAIQSNRMGNLRSNTAQQMYFWSMISNSFRQGSTQEEFFHTFNELQGKTPKWF